MSRLLIQLLVATFAVGAVVGAVGLMVPTTQTEPRSRDVLTEHCIDCHTSPKDDPGGPHAAARIGCRACHLGDPDATVAGLAHVGLEREPGALDTVDRTCGPCHLTETATVQRSLMATNRGLIAVNRWAFGEQATPDGTQTVHDVLSTPRPTPAEDHLRRLCAGCHLGTRKDNRDDAVIGIGSGCGSCHGGPRGATSPFSSHRPVDGRVADTQCFGCHSRSGRISLSYQGLAEIAPDSPPPAACGAIRALPDGRPACVMPADVHQRAGLGCIDCHLHVDVMGDGQSHAHAADAVAITCEACHGPVRPGAVGSGDEIPWAEVTDGLSRDRLRQVRQTRPDSERVRLGRGGIPVWNLRPDALGAGWTLTSKLDGRAHAVKPTPTDLAHTQPGHERLTCSACHSEWAPRCATCHTAFEPSGQQWDFGLAREGSGAWQETHVTTGVGAGFDVAPPSLGVLPTGAIGPAVPGMVAHLDASAAGGPRQDVRLYAPASPHTTGRARTCASCHADGRALGLGTGSLSLATDPPRFTPTAPGADGLAPDRWTTLFAITPGMGTRVGARSLDAAEQGRVLRVGYCLTCHAATESNTLFWKDFESSCARFLAGGARACTGRITAARLPAMPAMRYAVPEEPTPEP